MNTFDLLQEKKIGWLMAGFAVLGSVVGLAAYLNQKKHNQVERELFELEKEIKRLQINKLKNGQE
jgi:hypothetical protein